MGLRPQDEPQRLPSPTAGRRVRGPLVDRLAPRPAANRFMVELDRVGLDRRRRRRAGGRPRTSEWAACAWPSTTSGPVIRRCRGSASSTSTWSSSTVACSSTSRPIRRRSPSCARSSIWLTRVAPRSSLEGVETDEQLGFWRHPASCSLRASSWRGPAGRRGHGPARASTSWPHGATAGRVARGCGRPTPAASRGNDADPACGRFASVLVASGQWPSLSRSSLTPAPRSGGRSTRSARRPTTRARSATALGCRIGCARCVAATGARGGRRRRRRIDQLIYQPWSPSPWMRAGPIWVLARSPRALRWRLPRASRAPVRSRRRDRLDRRTASRCRRAGLDRQGRRSRARGAIDARGVDRAGRPGGRRRPRPGARVRRLDRLGAGRRTVQPAPRPRHLSPGAGAAPAGPRRRPVLLLDVGANVTCRPEHLVQFAHMGSAFARGGDGRSTRPRVALLSNGEEPAKGTPELVRPSTSSSPATAGTGLNFVGNIEGTQVTESVADVSSWTASPATSR